jgi:hypothetical protein
MDPEIVTRVEQAPGAAEPMLTFSQLRALLQDAAALERAQRPVVVHTAPQPATAPQTAPAGASAGGDRSKSDNVTLVHVPMPPVRPYAAVAVDQPRNPWPLLFMVSGCCGLAGAGTAAATGNQYAILAFFASVALWGTATYQLVFNRKG